MTEQHHQPEQTSEEEILAPVEEAEGRGLGVFYRIRKVFATIWRTVGNFEEKHPWVFFGGASVFVFLIILAVVSVFVSSDRPDSPDPKPVVQEDIVQPDIQVTVGAIDGIDAARLLSNATVVEELTSPLSRLERGGYIDLETDNPVASLLITVRAIEELLVINVSETLDRSADRKSSFDTYVEELTRLEQRASVLYLELNRQHEIEALEIQDMIIRRNQALDSLNSILASTGDVDQVDELYEQYAQLTAHAARRNAQNNLLVTALSSTRVPLQLAQLRLGGMIANEDALINDVTFVDIDGAGISLFKKGELSSYYEPSIEFDGTPTSSLTGSSTSNSFADGSDTNINSPGGLLPTLQNSQAPIKAPNIVKTIPKLEVLGLEEAFSGNDSTGGF